MKKKKRNDKNWQFFAKWEFNLVRDYLTHFGETWLRLNFQLCYARKLSHRFSIFFFTGERLCIKREQDEHARLISRPFRFIEKLLFFTALLSLFLFPPTCHGTRVRVHPGWICQIRSLPSSLEYFRNFYPSPSMRGKRGWEKWERKKERKKSNTSWNHVNL